MNGVPALKNAARASWPEDSNRSAGSHTVWPASRSATRARPSSRRRWGWLRSNGSPQPAARATGSPLSASRFSASTAASAVEMVSTAASNDPPASPSPPRSTSSTSATKSRRLLNSKKSNSSSISAVLGGAKPRSSTPRSRGTSRSSSISSRLSFTRSWASSRFCWSFGVWSATC